MKKTFIFLLIFIVSFFAFGTFAEGVSDTNNNSVDSFIELEDCNVNVKELLKTIEDVDYYAYLNLDSTEDSLKPVILEARRMYIERIAGEVGGLAADGVYAEEIAPDGTVVRVIPQFHELFPADWDYPG